MLKGKIDPQSISIVFIYFSLRAVSTLRFASFDASTAKAEFTTTAKIKILNGFIFFLFMSLFALSSFNEFRAGRLAKFSHKK